MTSEIIFDHLSIKFRLYHDHGTSMKEHFAQIFRKKKVAGFSDFWAVRDFSTKISAGERVGIIGRNGAGKSTLLKALCRIYEPTEGTLKVKGSLAPLLEIGAGFHPEFTGRENIYLNGTILGFDKQLLKAISPEVIAFAELEEFIDTPVKYYSTGMYMRLAFSLATAMHPDILILDELFAGGDVGFVDKAKKRMLSFIDRASIMVMVSHESELIRTLCTRVIWLDHGRIVADGKPEEVLAQYTSRLAA